MKESIKDLKKLFYEIKNKGWIESDTNNLGSIGHTFEKLLGIQTNELEFPDFEGIEIKTKNKYSSSYTTLFCCTPTGPHFHEVERLKDLYGYPDSKLKEYNVLNTSVYSKYKNKVGTKYYFEIKVDKEKQKIFLLIFNCKKELIEDIVYWDFDILEEKLYRKLKYLAFIKADKIFKQKKRYFKYYSMKIYKLKDFETFIDLIENRIIRLSLKIGVFRTGKKVGQIHDHGTSFCIEEDNLDKLYDLIEIHK